MGLSLHDMMFLTAKGLKASILGLTGDKTGNKRSRESEKIGGGSLCTGFGCLARIFKFRLLYPF